MIYISEIEKKQKIGWKIIERSGVNWYETPWMSLAIERGGHYNARGIEEEGIYVFLNKIYAKKFLNWLITEFKCFQIHKQFVLAEVELGAHIWKGKVNPEDGFNGKTNEHFFTTDRIRVLQIEDYEDFKQ